MVTPIVKFGEPGWRDYFKQRNKEMMELFSQGMTATQVARHFGISRARVMQVKSKIERGGYKYTPTGPQRRWEDRREE